MTKQHPRRSDIALACALALAAPALYAQGVATEAELAPVVVTGAAVRSGLPASLPSTTASKTREQLSEQNLFNPEDALQYAPNTTIRKRYPGDRNALVAGRSFGSQLGRVLGAEISVADKKLILRENLRRLLQPALRRKGIEA